jgi:inositol transport system permease protein
MSDHSIARTRTTAPKRVRRLPVEINILVVLIGIALVFELLGWLLVDQSFLLNPQRLTIMILQVSVIGVIAVGVTQVIITSGIDLSSGSVVGMTAMIAASFAQASDWSRALYPSLTDLPAIVPIGIGIGVGTIAGLTNGLLIAYTKIPPFIATLGMMVAARGIARWYTKGQPISGATEQFGYIGSGVLPVIVFLVVALVFHVVLRYTRYGKFTYAIGANPHAARVSGINVEAHLVKVYAIAGMLAGLAWRVS